MRIPTRIKFIYTALIVASVFSFLLSLSLGAVQMSISEIWEAISGVGSSHTADTILWALRIPRTFAAFMVGAALSTSGLNLQTVLRNPLAEPYTLGLSGGSCLGVIVAIVLGLQPEFFWLPAGSLLGCWIAVGIVLWLAGRKMGFESRGLILFGVMVSLFCGALVVTLLSTMSPDSFQSTISWVLGEFGSTRDPWIIWIGPILFVLIILNFLRVSRLNFLQLGEARSFSLGIEPAREKMFFILISTFLTSLAVSISGLIGFVGLVSPHITRRLLKTSRHELLLPAASLVGGCLLVLADTLGRVISTGEVPAGSLAALLGAPILIVLLLGRAHASSE